MKKRKNFKFNKKAILILVLTLAFILGLSYIIVRNNKVEPQDDLTNKIIENIPTKEIPSGITYDEDGLEVEGFEESNPNLISGNTGNDEKFIVGAVHSQPVYYSQVDSRWENHPYTSTGNKSQTIGTSGCGPTSAAMVVTTIKGTITPADMGDLFVRYGYRSANSGTYLAAFPWTAKYFDIPYKSARNIDEAVKALRDGYLVIASCGEGLFTYGGHLIVLTGVDGNTITVYDPYLYNGKFETPSRQGKVKVTGTTVYVSIDNFKKYSGATGFYCYFYKDPTPNPKPVTPDPEPTTPTKSVHEVALEVINGQWGNGEERKQRLKAAGYDYDKVQDEVNKIYNQNTNKSYKVKVTANLGLNIRKGPSTNYNIVGAYTKGTVVTITETSSNWGKTNKGWICLDYTSKTSSSSSSTTPTSKYSLGRYKVTATHGLNVRTGPGTNYSIIKAYTYGTIFDTYQIKGDWAKTPSGWVSLQYAKLLYKY